jgi:hypothetical protein
MLARNNANKGISPYMITLIKNIEVYVSIPSYLAMQSVEKTYS